MVRWHSSARPTCTRSSCCKRGMPNQQRSRGLLCRIPGIGEGKPAFCPAFTRTTYRLWRFPTIEEFKEAKHGTRNSTVVIGRADTGDHPVVVILRPLTTGRSDRIRPLVVGPFSL